MLKNKRYVSLPFSETRLGERNRPLSILLDISNFLSASRDLGELTSGALCKVMDYFDFNGGRVYILDESGLILRLLASKGIETRGLEVIRLSEGFSGKSARTRSFIAQHVSELEDQDRAELLMHKGFKVIVCVPLIALDRVVGVMNLAAKQVISLDQGMVDNLIAIGNLIAIAAKNAKLFYDIQQKIKEVQDKKETIKFFTYSTLHDLKGPAIGIHGLTKRLKGEYEAGLGEKGVLYCDQILKASEQFLTLVEKLNAYITSKEAPLDLEEFQLDEVLEGIREEFTERLEESGAALVVSVPGPIIVADRLAITRVFRNLIDNALKYGGEILDRIQVGFRENEAFQIINVGDNGVGISELDSKRLFNLFQRNDTSRGVEGLGLGLAIVKEIVERHGGRVWVENDFGAGATFYFSILKDIGKKSAFD